MTDILALIPARGGSKSIPRKNLIPLLGKPLILYSIEQGQQSQHISRVIVSTDDAEIAEVARQQGADVPFMRPVEYAQDMSTDFDVFDHALKWLRDYEQYTPELVVHLRPTGPVRRVALIDDAIRLMLTHPEADALRSVAPALQTPYKMWHIEGDYLRPLLGVEGMAEPYCMPRQSLPSIYWQNGYVDIIRPRTVLDMRLMAGKTILPFVVYEPMYEIDYLDNLPVVEEALRLLHQGELPPGTPDPGYHSV